MYRKIGIAIISRHSLIYRLLSSLVKVTLNKSSKNRDRDDEVDNIDLDVIIYASMELLFGWVVF